MSLHGNATMIELRGFGHVEVYHMEVLHVMVSELVPPSTAADSLPQGEITPTPEHISRDILPTTTISQSPYMLKVS